MEKQKNVASIDYYIQTNGVIHANFYIPNKDVWVIEY